MDKTTPTEIYRSLQDKELLQTAYSLINFVVLIHCSVDDNEATEGRPTHQLIIIPLYSYAYTQTLIIH